MIPHLPTIRAYRRPAHLIIPRAAETPLARHVTKFGGFPYLLQNERWPVCSACQEPMAFVLQVNFADLPPQLRLGRYDLLAFYYCLDCCPRSSLDDKGFQLHLRRTSPHDELQPAHFALRRDDKAEPQECAVVFRPFEDLPPAESIVAILGTDEEAQSEYERYVEILRGGNLYASKMGGYPSWIEAEPTMRCQCGAGMRFLAQIDSEEQANLLWGNNGVLYLFHCPQPCDPWAVRFVIQSE